MIACLDAREKTALFDKICWQLSCTFCATDSVGHYSTLSSSLLLQELVEDGAVATSSRHAGLSWARRFVVASPRFIGRRSASTVLSQDCLGRPALRLQSPGEYYYYYFTYCEPLFIYCSVMVNAHRPVLCHCVHYNVNRKVVTQAFFRNIFYSTNSRPGNSST